MGLHKKKLSIVAREKVARLRAIPQGNRPAVLRLVHCGDGFLQAASAAFSYRVKAVETACRPIVAPLDQNLAASICRSGRVVCLRFWKCALFLFLICVICGNLWLVLVRAPRSVRAGRPRSEGSGGPDTRAHSCSQFCSRGFSGYSFPTDSPLLPRYCKSRSKQ